MNFKPSDFFLSAVTFFGVLVPGTILVFLQGDRLLSPFGFRLEDLHWLVIVGVGYVFGHFLLAFSDLFNDLGDRTVAKIWCSPWQRVEQLTRKVELPEAVRSMDPRHVFHAAHSLVRLKHAEAALEIDRHMADYKLLRNLVLVFLIDLILTVTAPAWPPLLARIGADLGLGLLAFLAFKRMLYWARLLALEYCLLVSGSKGTTSGCD
jgi:hypothetical protein